jgi:hypothetical protein
VTVTRPQARLASRLLARLCRTGSGTRRVSLNGFTLRNDSPFPSFVAQGQTSFPFLARIRPARTPFTGPPAGPVRASVHRPARQPPTGPSPSFRPTRLAADGREGDVGRAPPDGVSSPDGMRPRADVIGPAGPGCPRTRPGGTADARPYVPFRARAERAAQTGGGRPSSRPLIGRAGVGSRLPLGAGRYGW